MICFQLFPVYIYLRFSVIQETGIALCLPYGDVLFPPDNNIPFHQQWDRSYKWNLKPFPSKFEDYTARQTDNYCRTLYTVSHTFNPAHTTWKPTDACFKLLLLCFAQNWIKSTEILVFSKFYYKVVTMWSSVWCLQRRWEEIILIQKWDVI